MKSPNAPTPPTESALPRLRDLPPRQARLCLAVACFLTEECGHDPAGVTWIAAYSGGPDSAALLAVLSRLAPRLGARLEAAHLDHGLRAESAGEAEAARRFCRECGIPLHLRRVEVADLAKTRGLGLEDAGRVARYAFFADLLATRPNAWMALGHQLNDLAEDQLMRLSRGTGWPALGGMVAVDPARRILRPLLLTPRREIEALVTALRLPVVRDPSNSDPAFFRNRLRTGALPLLAAENPRHLDAAARLWRQARCDADYFACTLPDLPDPATLPLPVLSGLHPALRLRLYRRALASLGPGQALADALFSLDQAVRHRATGRHFQFPGGKSARITRQEVTFRLEASSRSKRDAPLTGLAGGGNEADCEKSNMLPAPVLTAAQESLWVAPGELSQFAFPAGHRKLIDSLSRDLRLL